MSLKLFSWISVFTALAIAVLGYLAVSPENVHLYESSLLSSLHLLTLAVGLTGVFFRAIYFRKDLTNREHLQNLFTADNVWGIAAFLWLTTGVLRAFGGFEKGSSYYLHNPVFHLKMGLFFLVFLLEIWPMVSLIKWRLGVSKGILPDLKHQKKFEAITYMETILVIMIVFVAGFMARGIFIHWIS